MTKAIAALALTMVLLLAPALAQARESSFCCRTSTARDGHTYRHPITTRTK